MALKSFNKIFTKQLSSFCTSANSSKITSVGIIVIGDEILKGEVTDTNSSFLAVELHKMGLQLKKISVIGDDVNEVSKEVHNFSKLYDYVLTSGGIGPTHDDITYEAVAVAFREKLILNSKLKAICTEFYNTSDTNCPGMKLAFIPESSKLNFKAGVSYPTVSVRNVYMFPGIPELLTKSFSCLKDLVFKSNMKFYSRFVYFNVTEEKIAEVLQLLVVEYPHVQFGSYPKLLHSIYKVKVTIESRDEESTKKAYNRLLTLVPEDYIVDVEDV